MATDGSLSWQRRVGRAASERQEVDKGCSPIVIDRRSHRTSTANHTCRRSRRGVLSYTSIVLARTKSHRTSTTNHTCRRSRRRVLSYTSIVLARTCRIGHLRQTTLAEDHDEGCYTSIVLARRSHRTSTTNHTCRRSRREVLSYTLIVLPEDRVGHLRQTTLAEDHDEGCSRTH